MTNNAEQTAPLTLTEEEFVQRYAGTHCEWVGGVVVPMSPSTLAHNEIIVRLVSMFLMYNRVNPIAKLMVANVTMRLELVERVVRRDPDVMLLLNAHLDRLTPPYVNGPADLVIEVVSPESAARDYVEKLNEYEAGGVPEYWIIDPERRDARFMRRDPESGRYVSVMVSEVYSTPLLPGFPLRLADLWAADFPDPLAILSAIQAALKSGSAVPPSDETGSRGQGS